MVTFQSEVPFVLLFIHQPVVPFKIGLILLITREKNVCCEEPVISYELMQTKVKVNNNRKSGLKTNDKEKGVTNGFAFLTDEKTLEQMKSMPIIDLFGILRSKMLKRFSNSKT